MKEATPVLTIDLFPELSQSMLSVLEKLSAEEWHRQTACSDWTVKDVALHLLGGNIGLLSRRRDGYQRQMTGRPVEGWDDLVELVDYLNKQWVRAARRISPRLLCELLRFTDQMVYEYLQSLDPHEIGPPVSWAGPDPAPVWLDIAREYTERWHHQQHVRETAWQPGLMQPRYLGPVLATFVRALPYTYRDVAAEEGTALTLEITGTAGATWHLCRVAGEWQLCEGQVEHAAAEVMMPQDIAWRLFTNGMDPAAASDHITIIGDRALGRRVMGMLSIITRRAS